MVRGVLLVVGYLLSSLKIEAIVASNIISQKWRYKKVKAGKILQRRKLEVETKMSCYQIVRISEVIKGLQSNANVYLLVKELTLEPQDRKVKRLSQ